MRSFYQDRLGTNIGKTLKTSGVFSGGAHVPWGPVGAFPFPFFDVPMPMQTYTYTTKQHYGSNTRMLCPEPVLASDSVSLSFRVV